METPEVLLALYRRAEEFMCIGRRAAHKAQQENRVKGIPNVFSINGIIYYELPNGELSTTDPDPHGEVNLDR